jgi:hypothetical protein
LGRKRDPEVPSLGNLTVPDRQHAAQGKASSADLVSMMAVGVRDNIIFLYHPPEI